MSRLPMLRPVLSVCLALLLLGGVVAISRAEMGTTSIRGDVTGDGEITAADALAVLSYTVGKDLPDSFTILPNGDTNGDGEVTAMDALIVLSYTVGKDVSQFPIGETLGETGGPVASVTIEAGTGNVLVGGTLQLSATVRDSTSAILEGQTVTWSTSDSTKATVSEAGLVTGVAIGNVIITATTDGASGTAPVTVVEGSSASTIEISPRSTTVLLDSIVQFTAYVRDAAGNPVEGRTITWSSSDVAVATVSDSGLVRGVALGTVSVVASAGETLSGETTVSVVAAAAEPNRTWVGNSGTDWSVAGNWDPEGVPIATDTIMIPGTAANQPELGLSTTSIAGLVMENGATLTIGANELQVTGRLDVDGEVLGTGKLAVQGVAGRASYVRGTLPNVSISGTTVLVGPATVIGTLDLSQSSILDINGQTLSVSENLSIRGGLQMRSQRDLVDVRGDALFYSDATENEAALSAGVIRVGGDVLVSGGQSLADPFPATGTHRLVLDGAVRQTVTNDGLPIVHIQELDIAKTAGDVVFSPSQWSPDGMFRVRGNVTSTSATGISGQARVNVHGHFTTPSGGSVTLRNLAIRGVLTAGSDFRPDTLTLLGQGQLIPAGAAYQYQNVVAGQSVSFTGTTEIAGSLLVGCLTTLSDCDRGGAVNLAGQVVEVGGDVRQTPRESQAPLFMTESTGLLSVRGGLLGPVGQTTGQFWSEAADWTAGTLRVGGDFFARGTGAAASGTHVTILDGPGSQELRTATGFHFKTFRISNQGGIVLNDDAAGSRQRVAGVHGDFNLTTAVALTGTGRLNVSGNVETFPGSSVENSAIRLGQVMNVAGTFSPDTAEFNNPGSTQTIQNLPAYRNVLVRGKAQFGGSMTFSGSLIVLPDAELNVEGTHVTVAENLEVSGILRMLNASDTLTVLGDSAVFTPGSVEPRDLYARDGVLRVAGSLLSDSTGLYPTRLHKVVLMGGSQRTVRGLFQEMEIAPTSTEPQEGLTLDNVIVRGGLTSTGAAARLTIDTLTVGGNAALVPLDTVRQVGPIQIGGDLWIRNWDDRASSLALVDGGLTVADGTSYLYGRVYYAENYVEEGEVNAPDWDPVLRGVTSLNWIQQPSDGTAGVPFDPAVAIELLDATGARHTTGSALVRLSGSSDVVGVTRVISSEGVATFPEAAPGASGESQTLTARSSGLQVQSETFSATASTAPVETVIVSPESDTTYVGATHQLTVTLTDASGFQLVGRTVTWSSSDTSLASVSESGLVTGNAVGTATITATSEGKSGWATVAVVPAPVAMVTISPDTATVPIGETQQLTATLTDSAGNPLTGRTVTWSSAETAVATVSSAGSVTGVAEGSATITATAEGKSATALVTVPPAVETVTISPQEDTVFAGATHQLTATLRDAAGNELTGRTVTWTSSDTDVATVDSAGGVTGEGAGAATITATAEGKSGTATITVPALVQTVTVFSGADTLNVGTSHQFSVELMDADGNVLTGREVHWESSNASVASVSSAGLVRGEGPGSTTIRAVSETKSGEATVTVIPDYLVTVAGGYSFETISASTVHTCGVTVAGDAYCWGNNTTGRLGDGSTTNSATPVAVAGGHTFESITAGDAHTCGVTTTGEAYCWGSNGRGRLGDGSTTNSATPVAVAGSHTFESMTAGRAHTCGVTTTGEAYCWGDNTSGNLGDGSRVHSATPVAVAGGHSFASVSAGLYHTCGVTAGGGAYCWGYGGLGQLGDGSTTDSYTPVAVAGGHSFSWVDAGGHYTCGLTTASAAYCWGYNEAGQLGDGSFQSSSTPVQVVGGHSFESLTTSSLLPHTCGVTAGGESYCWGNNNTGQLGDGSTVSATHTPRAVADGHHFRSVDAGANHTCGIAPDGPAYCWGHNSGGRLGGGQ